jgi:hypothetical protein
MKCVICEADASVEVYEVNEHSNDACNLIWYLCKKHYIAARNDRIYDSFEGWRDFVLGIKP